MSVLNPKWWRCDSCGERVNHEGNVLAQELREELRAEKAAHAAHRAYVQTSLRPAFEAAARSLQTAGNWPGLNEYVTHADALQDLREWARNRAMTAKDALDRLCKTAGDEYAACGGEHSGDLEGEST